MVCTTSIHDRYRFGVSSAITGHLAASSRRTYRTGVTHFLRFCTNNNLDFDLSSPGLTKREYALYFVFDLHSKRNITSTVINQYVSHVCTTLIEQGIIENSSEFRSSRLHFLLKSFKRTESIDPLRLRQRIPAVFVVVTEAFFVISQLFGSDSDLALALKASFAAGYGCTLRPQEYLLCPKPLHDVPLTHQLCTPHSTFWWGDSFWYVYNLHGCPPLESVENFVSILDFNKNHQFGDGGPRSIGAAPAGVPFCLVKTLLSYFLRFGATINSPLLSSHGSRVTNTQVDRILKVVATNLSLPLHKLTPASLRAGAPNQLIDFSEEFRCMQGAWKTTRGMQVYMREYLRKSMLTAPALHDPSIVPVSHLQFAHQTPIAR